MRFSDLNGARIYPDQSFDWRKWSLAEYFEALGVVTTHEELRLPEEYVTRLSGWVNRINDIRERIRCRGCKNIMVADKGYAKHLAAYNATVFHCKAMTPGCFHDRGVYLSHCWACHRPIDSRQARFKSPSNYYICLECGSGEKKSVTFTQGDLCPACGTANMQLEPIPSREMVCRSCDHAITLPGENSITGPAHKVRRIIDHLHQRKHASGSRPSRFYPNARYVLTEIDVNDDLW